VNQVGHLDELGIASAANAGELATDPYFTSKVLGSTFAPGVNLE